MELTLQSRNIPFPASEELRCQGNPWENKWSPWAHRELTVTTAVTAPGPNDHGSVTARLGHSSVTARSQLNHGDHGSVTARSQLNRGPGHGSVTAGYDHFGHRELTMSSWWAHGEQSRWPIFFSCEVVLHNMENKHDFVKTLPAKLQNLYVFDEARASPDMDAWYWHITIKPLK